MIGTVPHAPGVPDPTRAQQPPDRLGYDARAAGRAAAREACRRYPGPAGLILAREIEAYVDFGFRVSHDSLMARLLDELAG